MKRFIPAWYRGDNWWLDEDTPFYLRGNVQSEFDDLISLMGMHLKNKVPFEMTVLNYMPDLRTFLHRHELFEATYWSLFDHIQGFTHQTPQVVDYRKLNWPKSTEFVHSRLMIKGIISEKLHYDMHFSQEGYLLWIETFRNGSLNEQYIFDDRGFLSSYMVADEDEIWDRKYYMTADGDWIMKEDLLSHEVTIHPKYAHRFEQEKYDDMASVIDECFKKYVQQHMQPLDVIIAASDERHNAIIAENLKKQKLCFSVFQKRRTWLSDKGIASMVNGGYWLTDTMENTHHLKFFKEEHQLNNQIMRITPFDAQITPNMSSQLYETYIGVWIDGMNPETLHQVISQLIHEIEREPQTRIILLTRVEQFKVSDWVNEEVYRVQEYFLEKTRSSLLDQDVAKNGAPSEIKYAAIKSVPFEKDIVEAISTLRLVIDLNKEPDLFLQICCIGAGLPQINLMQTDYVQHERNGYIIPNIEALPSAINFYLKHLKNWNHSYSYAMKLSKQYTSNEILKQLDDWLEGEIHGTEI
ncbi:accessory Sec system protein Asp1 [Staphylococcus delphini]|uniref:Accessory Sec system protein Asp1 n=1 Tax=Staphylococcus delphini TaxID=53344 RepID=A0A2A4GX84_9STAP|nr:accessory Sec system protein Asp1 [Staphylococcus delphini]PCF55317.1 accessory Sec system protein Asp1 [Staphylococcus delphini]PCF60894.1 accessory Sec system protein Asp1 [Staphylococcus delphini]PCF72331.1 accessory Sec system protein Asp1 [Staphylococcus delphini]HEC2157898.1 accessory Sec system protein Asp1 [Staphylococcus delphini]